MASWENMIATAKDFAVAAGQKITNMADAAGLKMELAEKERALNDVMAALGHLLYDSRKDDCAMNEELVAELTKQADLYYKQIGRLQNAIDELRSRKTCNCGAVNPENAAYCNECGEKL